MFDSFFMFIALQASCSRRFGYLVEVFVEGGMTCVELKQEGAETSRKVFNKVGEMI